VQWALDEANGPELWAKVQAATECDATTMSQSDLDQGVVNIEVGVALLKPAEFVLIRIQDFLRRSLHSPFDAPFTAS